MSGSCPKCDFNVAWSQRSEIDAADDSDLPPAAATTTGQSFAQIRPKEGRNARFGAFGGVSVGADDQFTEQGPW